MDLIFGASQTTDLSRDDVAAAYPWPDSGPWVRAMMVTTLDGAAAGPDGLSGSISSAADQMVFNAVRRFADCVLVGSGTLRAEEYTPMRAKAEDVEARTLSGQQQAPVLAIVSGSLDLPWHLAMWSESTHKPIVITDRAAAADRLAIAREHADLLLLDEVTPQTIVHALTTRGLRRIVCEGGPRLLNDFVRAGAIDELDITISPMMAGSAGSPATALLPASIPFHLSTVLTQQSFLMARYLKERP
jgi:riboflavin biosynthesis pyrimidine reductase